VAYEHDHYLLPAVPAVSRRAFLGRGGMGVGALMLGTLLDACTPRQRDRDAQSLSQPAGTVESNGGNPPGVPDEVLEGFAPFAATVKVFRSGSAWMVESTGMPAHNMMVGIKSWQQQVPLPQPYAGNNAWRIPAAPVIAKAPVSAKTALYRGAIALAVNGVPIFNALNNRGDDAYLAGELDEWGGHSGRADDYHYHIAPLHLQSLVGKSAPIGYALDGSRLYGLDEPDGTSVAGLDEFNGHVDKTGVYHYHSTRTYPYINGGLRGVIQVRDDQVDPQPAAAPVRPPLQPLRGATITGFKTIAANSFSLEYRVNDRLFTLNYGFSGNTYTFEFVDPSGARRTETYRRR
jgi:hypothetical protein